MNDNKKQAEKIKEISGANPLKCMKCGKCSASCPSYNEMDIKPHQFVSYVQNENIEALVNSKSLWKCLSCFACVERCPRNVQPGKLIDLSVPQRMLRRLRFPEGQRACRKHVHRYHGECKGIRSRNADYGLSALHVQSQKTDGR